MSIGYLGMAVMRFTALIGTFNQQFYDYSQQLAKLSEQDMNDGVGEERQMEAMENAAKNAFNNNPDLQKRYQSYLHMPYVMPSGGSASKSFGAGFINNGGPTNLKDITKALLQSGNFGSFMKSLQAGGGQAAGYSTDGKALAALYERLGCAVKDGKDRTGATTDDILGEMLKDKDFSKYLGYYLIATGVATQNPALNTIIQSNAQYNQDRNLIADEIIKDATTGKLNFNMVPVDSSLEDVYQGLLDGGMPADKAKDAALSQFADGCSDARFANTPQGGGMPTAAATAAATKGRPLFERVGRAVVQPLGALLQSKQAKRAQIRAMTTQIEQKIKAIQTKIQMFEGMLQSAEKALQKAIQRIFGGQGQ